MSADVPPLTGVLAVELGSGIASGYAGKLLADAGATVLKVEDPTGDPIRRWSASGTSVPEGDDGALFRYIAASKRSVVTDIQRADDLELLDALLEAADAIIWSPGSPITEDDRFSAQALRAQAPQAVVLALTSFGLEGPWAGRAATEFTVQAWSGGMLGREGSHHVPLSVGGRHGEWVTAVHGAIALLTALHRRNATGEGELLDVSMLEVLTITDLQHPMTDASLTATADRAEHATTPGAEPGAVRAADPRTVAASEITSRMLVASPRGGFLQPDVAYRSSHLQTRPLEPAPLLGAHTSQARDLVHAIDAEATPIPAHHATTNLRRQHPFSGVRIADFTSGWAGPALTRSLAMLGADVIHIESVAALDSSRHESAQGDHPNWCECSPSFHACNSSKRSLTLDLTLPEGRSLARSLIEHCDVVVDGHRPGTMERWGLGPEEVIALRPDSIMLRLAPFGLDGSWRDQPADPATLEAITGMSWLTGDSDSDPVLPGGRIEAITAAHGALTLLLAIEQRRRTGAGMLVEVPMAACGLTVTAEQLVEYGHTGNLIGRSGNHGLSACPQNVYLCADVPDDDPDVPDDDPRSRWVAIAVESDEHWQALSEAIGDPGWTHEPGLDDAAGRQQHQDRLDHELAAWCATLASAEVVSRLWPRGVPVGIVLGPDEIGTVEQHTARGFFETVAHPVTGLTMYAGSPVRYSAGPAVKNPRPAPTLGQHNHEILGGLLRLNATEIARLESSGVIGTRPVG